MQDRVWTIHLGQHTGERVVLAGWLHRLRRLSGVSFLILRDRTGTAQVVIEDPAILAALDGCQHETVLRITGDAVQEAQAPGGVEVRNPTIEIVTPVAEPPPLELFRPNLQAQLPTVLDHAAVALRHPRNQAIFRLAAAAMTGYRRTLRAAGFTEIQTPKIVASATESGANVFEIDYFGRPAYLAQSPQFYKQMMVGVFERVFEIGPVFRAEPHATARHVNEYVSLDFEMGFIDDHHDVMAMLARALDGMIAAMREDAPDAVAYLKLALPEVPAVIPEIQFADALDLIWRETGEDARGEPDLAPAHERFLSAWAQREYGSDFLFVVGYPMVKRPFYTYPDPARPAYSNSFDLLFRGLELVTGGQRLHRYADYLAALEARRMTPDSMAGYLEAFRCGMPPHGGCAIGLERWIAQLAGLDNIREATLFPRDLNRLTP